MPKRRKHRRPGRGSHPQVDDQLDDVEGDEHSDHDDGRGAAANRTKKYDCDDALARPIVTAYLGEAEHALLATLDADALAKRRYRLTEDGVAWSLDAFTGPLDGLELLESEAADGAALVALRPPSWAIREVSADPRYEGGTLAAHGPPKEEPWRPS